MLLKGIALAALVLSGALGLGCGLSLLETVLVFAGTYLALFLLALGFLFLVCALVDTSKPQEHDDPFYRAVMYVYVELLINLVRVRLHTRGLENTPGEGRFLLVCNHLFIADPGILLHCFRKSQLAFVTKQENQKLPVINKFMHKTLCQNLNRENDREALKTILKCIQLIREEEVSIAIFPEGGTSKDGMLHPFRAGAFKIAQKTKVPIVVCTIQGTRSIFKNLAHLRHTDVDLHLLEVIEPEQYAGMNTVEISDMVYEKMIADLGEERRWHAPDPDKNPT